MKYLGLQVGAYLSTLDGELRTNAIVSEITGDDVVVITDFGNILDIKKEDVFKIYSISPNWISAIHYEYPLPSVKERIQEQINKLQECLLTLE